jgi:5'-nucleotidase
VLDRILLTNDDGIDAPGLAVLADIAAELANEVWIVAPQHDQSGVSHAISLHHPLRVVAEGERRYGVTGTPGDCVVMGVCHLMRDARPDLILSGVNRGANMGMETVFSGTVGGAMTGMMLGIPSIGLSQAFSDRGRVPWDVARTLGAGVVRQMLEIGWSAETCLNINFPDRPVAEVGPPTLCRQGVGLISGMNVESGTDPRGIDYHWINFRRAPREQGPDSDADAIDAGRIAVTPIRYDRTDEAAFAALTAHLPRLKDAVR